MPSSIGVHIRIDTRLRARLALPSGDIPEHDNARSCSAQDGDALLVLDGGLTPVCAWSAGGVDDGPDGDRRVRCDARRNMA